MRRAGEGPAKQAHSHPNAPLEFLHLCVLQLQVGGSAVEERKAVHNGLHPVCHLPYNMSQASEGLRSVRMDCALPCFQQIWLQGCLCSCLWGQKTRTRRCLVATISLGGVLTFCLSYTCKASAVNAVSRLVSRGRCQGGTHHCQAASWRRHGLTAGLHSETLHAATADEGEQGT